MDTTADYPGTSPPVETGHVQGLDTVQADADQQAPSTDVVVDTA